MARGPRLDAPGVLHHVMVRGIERRPLFRDDRDRDDFVERLAGLVQVLGQTRGNVSLAAKRGEEVARPWRSRVDRWCR